MSALGVKTLTLYVQKLKNSVCLFLPSDLFPKAKKHVLIKKGAIRQCVGSHGVRRKALRTVALSIPFSKYLTWASYTTSLGVSAACALCPEAVQVHSSQGNLFKSSHT